MRHPATGRLRAAVDGAAFSDRERDHLEDCRSCATRLHDLARRASATSVALAPAGEPLVAIDGIAARRTFLLADRLRRRRESAPWRRFASLGAPAVAAAAIVLILIAADPLRSFAESLVAVFRPVSVVPIALEAPDLAGLRSFPKLSTFGPVEVRESGPTRHLASIDAASAAADFVVDAPAALPAGVPPSPHFVVTGRSETVLTFESARGTSGASASPPAGLDGSTLRATFGPIVITSYGSDARLATTPADVEALLRGAPAPLLAIVQMPLPEIVSSGAPAADLEAYLLARPGISPHLARELAALGDLRTTLPIPVPIDRAFARSAIVHGSSGMTFGDETSAFAGAAWQADGTLHLVYGRLPLHDVTAVANALGSSPGSILGRSPMIGP